MVKIERFSKFPFVTVSKLRCSISRHPYLSYFPEFEKLCFSEVLQKTELLANDISTNVSKNYFY